MIGNSSQSHGQERFEDYLELEQYIHELQAGHVAFPRAPLTSSQARIYRMVLLFHSASPEGNEPRPEFIATLQTRLEQELHRLRTGRNFPFLRKSRRARCMPRFH